MSSDPYASIPNATSDTPQANADDKSSNRAKEDGTSFEDGTGSLSLAQLSLISSALLPEFNSPGDVLSGVGQSLNVAVTGAVGMTLCAVALPMLGAKLGYSSGGVGGGALGLSVGLLSGILGGASIAAVTVVKG